MSKISVVIPAYNEEKSIAQTLNSVIEYFHSEPSLEGEIIVSDDGSLDSTVTIVRQISLSQKNIRLIKNTHQGKARAVRSGIKESSGEFVLLMDADGATRINELNKLLSALIGNDADIVIGSREGLKSQRLNEPYYRHLMGRVFNKVVRLLAGLNFNDTQCGFKLFRKNVIDKLSNQSTIMNYQLIDLKNPLVTAFDVELLVLAQIYKFKVIEIPIIWQYIPTSKVNPINDSIGMFLEVLKIRINLLTGKYHEN